MIVFHTTQDYRYLLVLWNISFAYVFLIALVSVWFLEEGDNAIVADTFSCQLDTSVPASESSALPHFTLLHLPLQNTCIGTAMAPLHQNENPLWISAGEQTRGRMQSLYRRSSPAWTCRKWGDCWLCAISAYSGFRRNALLLYSGETCIRSPLFPPSNMMILLLLPTYLPMCFSSFPCTRVGCAAWLWPGRNRHVLWGFLGKFLLSL